jgi:hypothetical protein
MSAPINGLAGPKKLIQQDRSTNPLEGINQMHESSDIGVYKPIRNFAAAPFTAN